MSSLSYTDGEKQYYNIVRMLVSLGRWPPKSNGGVQWFNKTCFHVSIIMNLIKLDF